MVHDRGYNMRICVYHMHMRVSYAYARVHVLFRHDVIVERAAPHIGL